MHHKTRSHDPSDDLNSSVEQKYVQLIAHHTVSKIQNVTAASVWRYNTVLDWATTPCRPVVALPNHGSSSCGCSPKSAATKLTTCSESTVHETKSYEIIQPFFSYLILLGNQPAILTHIRWHATTQSSSDCWISNKKLSSRVATKTVRHLWMVEHAYSWLSRKRFIQPHMETTRRCIQNSSRYRSCRLSSKQNLNRFSFSLFYDVWTKNTSPNETRMISARAYQNSSNDSNEFVT